MAKKKRTTRAGARKKVRRKRRAKRGLATVSIADLHSELTRRLESLQARRDELAEELEALDAEIAGVEGEAAPRRRRRVGRPARKKKRVGRPAKKKKRVGRPAKKKKKRVGRPAKKKKKRVTRRKTTRKKTGSRPRNTGSLVEALKKLLTGKTMTVTEMADAVQKAGYKTSSPNFRTIVNQTLINNKKDFKRVARGQYTAK
ncbi:MAG: hypothetical protein SYC29_08400 [Planctomycetota bacterium]|nr:hypothetical protein [Planctomycetota bacterium]